MDLQVKLEACEMVVADKEAESVNLFRSWDSYQSRVTSLTVEMEDKTRTNHNLMRENVDLKSEVEGLRKVVKEVVEKVADTHRRIDDIVIS